MVYVVTSSSDALAVFEDDEQAEEYARLSGNAVQEFTEVMDRDAGEFFLEGYRPD